MKWDKLQSSLDAFIGIGYPILNSVKSANELNEKVGGWLPLKAAENILKRKMEQGQSKTLEEVMYIDK